MSSFHRSPPMRTVKPPPRALIQNARRYLNWWDPRFSERFFGSDASAGRVCTPVSCVYIGACVCAPYVKCCVGSVTARARALLTLPSSYLQVLLCHEERSRAYPRASLARACIRSNARECRRKDERCRTWRGTCVRHERCMPKCRQKSSTSSGKTGGCGRSALLPHSSPERADYSCRYLEVTAKWASRKLNPWLTRITRAVTLIGWQKVAKRYWHHFRREITPVDLRLCALVFILSYTECFII